jgi:hypothetical protein
VSLIILCTWASAQPKHITKYSEVYQRHFPSATVIIIQSVLRDILFRADPNFELAGRLIASSIDRGSNSVLLHAFSNGGLKNATQLVAALPLQHCQQAFCAVILDSSPGDFTYWQTAKTIIFSLPPNPILRSVGAAITYPVLFMVFLLDHVGVLENPVGVGRRLLNNESIFDLQTPRLYVYSKADGMVPWRAVHEHAQQARETGFKLVEEVVFERSGHCALILEDEEKYWNAIWKVASGAGRWPRASL